MTRNEQVGAARPRTPKTSMRTTAALGPRESPPPPGLPRSPSGRLFPVARLPGALQGGPALPGLYPAPHPRRGFSGGGQRGAGVSRRSGRGKGAGGEAPPAKASPGSSPDTRGKGGGACGRLVAASRESAWRPAVRKFLLKSRTARGAGMPSYDPSTPPSWPAEDKRRPLARPGPIWGRHMGQPEKMERVPRHGPPKPSCPGSEGEKDSGFSDRSSECLSALEQTDTGDQGSPPLPPGPAEWQEAKGGLTPLYLIQNVILEQTLGVSPTAPFLAWSNQRPLDSAYSSAAHLLLFQEPTASLKPMVPSQKPSAKEIRFPTLGAYPRIAPHPGRQPEEAPSPAAEPIRHKRLYVGEAWAPPEAPTGKDSWEKSPEGLPTSLQTAALVCPQAPAHPPLPCAGRRAAVKGARRPGEHSLVRQRRLHNTVEILRRSGLLGITLRTKQLLRQNSRAQRELAQLREEARLLCQAVQSRDWQAWARLQGAIGHSAAPCLPSKGAGTETHLGQQPNLATQPPGLDTPLPMALP